MTPLWTHAEPLDWKEGKELLIEVCRLLFVFLAPVGLFAAYVLYLSVCQ